MIDRRICFVSLNAYGYFNREYGFTGGGQERQSYLYGTELADEFDVHFVVRDHGQPSVETRQGVTLHKAHDPDPDATVVDKMGWLRSLVGLMRRIDADLYVYRSTPDFGSVVCTLAELLGSSWVYGITNDANIEERPARLDPLRRLLYEYSLRRAEAVVVQTEYQARRLRDSRGVETTVIPNGYPSADSVVPYDEREYFLWVGRLEQTQKRPHLFLDLAERLPNYEFRLVGPESRDAAYQRRLSRRFSDIDNVEYVGAVPPEDIHSYFADAIALINTSRFEGFPNTFLESWRVATPVVSLAIDLTRYLDGEPVRGYADGDFDELIRLADSLGGSVANRRDMGSSAKAEFEERYELSRVAEQYRQVLDNAT